MDTKVNYTIVGGFVIILSTAIIFAIVWLSSGLSITKHRYFLVYSQESVSGLNVDASVEYNGIVVGSVKEISLAPFNRHLVKLLLQIDSDTPISKGTIATLSSRGITGVTFLALKDNGKDPSPLLVKPGEEYPVIPTAPSLFMRLDLVLNKLAKHFESMTISLQALLNKQNLSSFQHILQQLDQITVNLANNNARINKLLLNTSLASEKLTPLLQHSSTMVDAITTQTLPATYRLVANLNTVLQNLNDVTLDLKSNPSILIRGAVAKQPGPGE